MYKRYTAWLLPDHIKKLKALAKKKKLSISKIIRDLIENAK